MGHPSLCPALAQGFQHQPDKVRRLRRRFAAVLLKKRLRSALCEICHRPYGEKGDPVYIAYMGDAGALHIHAHRMKGAGNAPLILVVDKALPRHHFPKNYWIRRIILTDRLLRQLEQAFIRLKKASWSHG